MTARTTRWASTTAWIASSVLLAWVAVAPSRTAAADDINTQFGPSKKPAKAAAASAPVGKDMKEWGTVTKDAEEKAGLFRIYKKKDAWYMAIRKDQLDKPYLLALDIGRGIGSMGIFGGTTLNEDVIRLRRKADTIQLLKDNVRFTATQDPALSKSVDLSYAPSVAYAFKIESERGDSVLVDIGAFVLSDYGDIVQGLKGILNGPPRIDDKRSTLGALKVFPQNVELEGDFTVIPTNRDEVFIRTIADQRYIPITMHYSLAALPDDGYVPRLEDDRIGYFDTAVKDFSRDSNESYMVHYINRWNLVKKDASAAVSEPVKPVVYYLENTIPEKWRPYIAAGVEEWNKAFEKAGFKNAIQAKQQPDNDSTWDAADIRYSTIRWISSSEPQYGAIGPSHVDPRTGENMDSDILIEASIILGYKNYYRRWVGPETAEELVNGISPTALKAGFGRSMCQYGMGMLEGGNLLNLGLMMNGSLPPGSPVPDKYIGQALKALTMHEVGHTLGLRHNFQSSVAFPMDRLGDASYIESNGLLGSVMDYDTPNIGKDPMHQANYFTPTLGPYDLWAIQYGYTPMGAKTPWDEKSKLADIASESTQPGHQYGTDEDTYTADALDPRNNIYDLGSDPLSFGERRTAYIQSLWSAPGFESRVLADGDGFPVLRRAMDALLIQYTRGLSHGVKYIGGQIVSRAHYGDPNAPGAFNPVPAAEQRHALAFLTRRAFAPDAFDVSPKLLDQMGADRYFDWEQNLFATGRIDYPWYQRVLTVQTAVLNRLLAPATLARVREVETRQVDALKTSELFSELTGSIWGEFGIGATDAWARQNAVAALKATNGPGTRRELQRTYVDALARWVTEPAAPGTDDARALARLQLVRIDGAAAGQLSAKGATLNDNVRAHLLETRARIKRALDAQRQVRS